LRKEDHSLIKKMELFLKIGRVCFLIKSSGIIENLQWTLQDYLGGVSGDW
jgi:hypothetical protein